VSLRRLLSWSHAGADEPLPERGHVADITAGCWHPRQSDEFITSSNDSTIRIWNTADRMKQKTVIVAKSKERGGRTKVTACAYSFDAKTIAGGEWSRISRASCRIRLDAMLDLVACEDGTLHLWATNSNMSRPSTSCDNAHQKYTETSGIVFAKDGRHLATRGGDDTVKRELLLQLSGKDGELIIELCNMVCSLGHASHAETSIHRD
jgi:WD40 repeat protein